MSFLLFGASRETSIRSAIKHKALDNQAPPPQSCLKYQGRLGLLGLVLCELESTCHPSQIDHTLLYSSIYNRNAIIAEWASHSPCPQYRGMMGTPRVVFVSTLSSSRGVLHSWVQPPPGTRFPDTGTGMSGLCEPLAHPAHMRHRPGHLGHTQVVSAHQHLAQWTPSWDTLCY